MSFSSLNIHIQTRLRGRRGSTSSITATCLRWWERTINPLTARRVCPGWCSIIPRELTRVSRHVRAQQVFQFVPPALSGSCSTLHGGNPAGNAAARAPLPAPLPSLPAGGATRTRGCFAPPFGDGSCNRHRSRSVTALVPSLINTRVNVVAPGEPRGTRAGSYLMGSCMACSHDQQWEKRWNMLRRDGLSSAPTKRAAWCVPVLHPPARARCPWCRVSHPQAISSTIPWPSTAASRLACTSQAWGQPPAPRVMPPGCYPPGMDPWPDPAPATPSCMAGAPVRLSPARPRRAAPAHIPFA